MERNPRLTDLTEREKEILRAVVQQFVLTANPVGSRQLSRKFGLDISPATIRNVMADLEEMGLLSHPHASAGRVPSDLGYRHYVNSLMESRDLPTAEREAIQREFDEAPHDLDQLMAVTARVLTSATRLLGIVLVPALEDAVLGRIDLVRLSERKVLIVITLETGPMRTVMAEVDQVVAEEGLRELCTALNQRLSGLTLGQIRSQISERIQGVELPNPGLVRFFVDSADKLFTFSESGELKIGGRSQVLSQPEFADARSMRGIIELLDDEDIVVHLLQSSAADSGVSISIGTENVDLRARDLSVLVATYRSDTISGKLGVIGPTRMDYSRVKSLVEFTARVIAKHVPGTKSKD